MTFRQSIDMPPIWLGLFAALAFIVGQVAPMSLGLTVQRFGWVLVIAGLGIMGVAFIEFRRHRTSVIPHQEATTLITSGLYRWSRNPIYLADAVILGGLCLMWNALPALLLVPMFMALITRRFIRPEEARLRAAFGPAFGVWAANTRRWL